MQRTILLPSLFVVLVLSVFPAFGQKKILQQSIYFETARYDLGSESKNTLDALLDSLKNFQTYKIFIKGNTDDVGDSAYNKSLSEKRVKTTADYFVSRGISSSVFTTAAFGEEKPIADNITEQGKQKNRRVDISIAFIRKAAVDSASLLPPVGELYKQTERKPQLFCINPKRDTVVRCEKGTLVYVKANAFKMPNACKTTCITLKVKEDFLASDMILDNLTTTSNGQWIETRGMVYTEANDCRGNKLNLLKGKDLVVFVPTDTVVPETKVFEGNRTPHDSIMNWTVSNTSVLGKFTLNELNICADWLGCGGILCTCTRCRFFFCRIHRLGTAMKGMVNKPTHNANVQFRRCQRQLRLERRLARKQKPGRPLPQSTALRVPVTLAPNLLPACERLKDLYEKYGVTNLLALTEAINKPLMDSLGVKTLTQLQDTMTKISLQNFELSYRKKSISYEDFKYYVYNTSRLGWSNLDVFADLPKRSLVTMKVSMKIAANVDCKLVFINRQFVIPASKTEGNYVFEHVPEGEKVWIVAIRFLDGKPFLSMQETTTGNKTYPVDFKLLTLDELKKELRMLDRQ